MIYISGFTDEIDNDLETQVSSAKKIGLTHISLRGINGENVSKFNVERIKSEVVPVLEKYDIKVSSIGSPIGKVFITDEEGFNEQLVVLEELCKICNLLDTKYIRMFSFYISEEENPDTYKDEVLTKLKKFIDIARKYGVCLIHENEKDIYGDKLSRVLVLAENLYSDNFKLIFDFANFVQVEENTTECYKTLKPYLEYIHIKDASYGNNENVLCGTGDGHIPEILKDLIENGYSGFLTLEPHLVQFDSLKDLELKDVNEIIKDKKELSSYDAFKMQFDAVTDIIK